MSAPELQQQQTASGLSVQDMLRLEMLTSLEKYTKAMFKAQYKRSFIVAEHHRQIIDALQDVVDGKCRRLIINVAPRYGKCLDPETPVYTTEGIRPIHCLNPNDYVYTYNNGKLAVRKIVAIESAYKDSIELTLRSGRKILGSYDHPMLTPFGYKELRDFKAGDRITAVRSKIDGNYAGVTDAELFFATAMIFDGNCGTTKPGLLRFASADESFMLKFSEAVTAIDAVVIHRDYYKSFEYEIPGGLQAPACRLLSRLHLLGHTAYNKRLPREWINLPMRQKYLFFEVMLATDGNISGNTGQFSIGLANKDLIFDIQALLSTMGVVSTVNYHANNKAGYWDLIVPRQYVAEILPHISMYGKEKYRSAVYAKSAKSSVDTYPVDIFRAEHLTSVFANKRYGYKCKPFGSVTRDKFRKMISIAPDKLSKYYSDDFYYDEVISVKKMPCQKLIHLEVEHDHNFIVNGLVSHNTELVIKSFISWCFALNPACRFLHLSYSDVLVEDNSATVRSIMQEPLYKALFPGSALLKDRDSSKRWKTKAGGEK